MKIGLRFHSMFSSLGWTAGDVAKFLQVAVSMVQLWVSNRVQAPYAAHKLLSLQLRLPSTSPQQRFDARIHRNPWGCVL